MKFKIFKYRFDILYIYAWRDQNLKFIIDGTHRYLP